MVRTSRHLLLLLLILAVQSSPGYTLDDGKPGSDDGSWPHYINDDNEMKNYRGHALLRVTPQDEYHLKMLTSLVDQSDVSGVDFWKEPTTVKKDVDIRVPPETKGYLSALMRANGLEVNVVSDDLQRLMDEERSTRSVKDNDNYVDVNSAKRFNLSTYHSYDEIMSYLDQLNSTCNSSTCRTQVIGKTYEGRDLKLIKIGNMDDKTKPAFWVDAGIHAREWISPAAALFLISTLLDEKNSVGRLLTSRFRWYILPLANPDGYYFSWTSDRLWRKNRSRHPDPKINCRGTDLNRNWDFHWGGRGTSDRPCVENYSGWQPFSEAETKAMANYIMSISDSLVVYLSLHSYGQYILTPWGYTTRVPSDYSDLVDLGTAASEAIRKTHGMRYTVGSAARVLYLASGGSDDWAKGVAGVKFSFTIELRDDGQNGFILPASKINETGEELVQAIRALTVGTLRRLRSSRRLSKN